MNFVVEVELPAGWVSPKRILHVEAENKTIVLDGIWEEYPQALSILVRLSCIQPENIISVRK